MKMQNKTKKLMAVILVAGMIVASGMLVLATYQNKASAQVQSRGNEYHVMPGGPLTPSEFIKQGGRSIVTVIPSVPVIDTSRGSSVDETLTFTHKGISNPLSEVTVSVVGIGNDLIPQSIVKSTTPHERAQYFETHGKPMPGTIDLNSLVTFSQKSVTLKPGESSNMTMNIAIPKNWPDDLVGKTILFGTIFNYGNSSTHDLLIYPMPVRVHVVS